MGVEMTVYPGDVYLWRNGSRLKVGYTKNGEVFYAVWPRLISLDCSMYRMPAETFRDALADSGEHWCVSRAFGEDVPR